MSPNSVDFCPKNQHCSCLCLMHSAINVLVSWQLVSSFAQTSDFMLKLGEPTEAAPSERIDQLDVFLALYGTLPGIRVSRTKHLKPFGSSDTFIVL